MQRIDIIRKLIHENDADAAVISRLTDIRWAIGFTGSNGLLIVDRDSAAFITDGRYTTQAADEVRGADVYIAPGVLEKFIPEVMPDAAARVLFQSEDVSVARLDRLREACPNCKWEGRTNLLTAFVARKSEEEIDAVRRAQAITDQTFEHVTGLIRAGMTERELAAEIVYDQLRRGAERMSFEPIVASGPNGALPHARPSTRELQTGDLVVLDFGCVVDGYASDMTRTVAIGDPDSDAVEAYDAVLDAQQSAIAAARSGMSARELDAAARDILRARGFGDYFSHGLGHGIGLETHEWPRVSHNSDDVLPEGAIVTIEPGVYLPGRFGIRIEDMIVLRENGADVLTSAPHDLLRL